MGFILTCLIEQQEVRFWKTTRSENLWERKP